VGCDGDRAETHKPKRLNPAAASATFFIGDTL